MTLPTLFHVSDPHLGHSGGDRRAHAAETAWAHLHASVSRDRPDLVIITGDLVVDDPDDPTDRALAHARITALDAPVLVVPGNHDVGDHAIRAGLPADWHGTLVSEARVLAWEALWGPSFWMRELEGWVLLGINAQILGSGLPAERRQWEWLERVALPAVSARPLLVFSHESLDARPETRRESAAESDSWMSIPSAASSRLAALLAPYRPVAVCAGHTHRHLDWTVSGFRGITAPSLTGAIPERSDMTAALGDQRPGWLRYTLENGALRVDQEVPALTATGAA
ncbi:metallophosphoesterase family protein [Mycetocola saprophilus]|uniref:metallophosphoesterase family protein n=1 Tax=Mycetocola saprophilus TaxID=76636 RepID=UPI000691E3C9|nr:metallophosphoesterase [Mycetocola saprophilus]